MGEFECNLPPLGEKCIYDIAPHCLKCYVHQLYAGMNNLKASLPVIGKYVGSYVCIDFVSEEGK